MAGDKDFISVKTFNKEEAKIKFGKDEEKGVILLTPFTDELLDVKYYTGITNTKVSAKIAALSAKGEIKSNPVLVVDGKPLRGNDIVTSINALREEDIYTIFLLKKKAAFALFGIRAIPGVLVIYTNEYHENHKEGNKPQKTGK